MVVLPIGWLLYVYSTCLCFFPLGLHIRYLVWADCFSFSLFKLDITVLQYRNEKLIQKLETQKVEYLALENKFSQLKEKHQPYDSTLTVVNKSWEKVGLLFLVVLLLPCFTCVTSCGFFLS